MVLLFISSNLPGPVSAGGEGGEAGSGLEPACELGPAADGGGGMPGIGGAGTSEGPAADTLLPMALLKDRSISRTIYN